MKHAVLIGILALAAAAVVAVSAQGKSASSLTFVTKQQAFSQVDVGKKGFSVGDSFIFVEQLLANGKTVGHDRVICTHVANAHAGGDSCTGTVMLDGGTIQLAGLASEGPFTVAGCPAILKAPGWAEKSPERWATLGIWRFPVEIPRVSRVPW